VVIAIYLVILVAAFYFLIVRPQRRQQMIRRQIIATVDVGDEIVTSGGVFGTVAAIDAETLEVEIAPGVIVKIARGAVAQKITGHLDDAEVDAGDDEGIARMDDEPGGGDAGDDHEDDDAES
jgi:preprotein translocase subunit YajC